ncbi:MAG TPA: DUF3618 domain-containing protein [Blastocatellia bacterium]|nr:DUF3618 domain-containing protein [Blastocatellia bacterium]
MVEATDLAMRRVNDAPLRSADEIRQDIAANRESITRTVDKLGAKLHEKLDWREYVADHPAAALGLAAGVGFLVSRVFRRRLTPRERIVEALADTLEDATWRVRDGVQSITTNAARKNGRGGISHTLVLAASAAFTNAAAYIMKSKLNELVAGTADAPAVEPRSGTGSYRSDRLF